jgi:excisionase family DNA binding protein
MRFAIMNSKINGIVSKVEAANILNISLSSVNRYIKAGLIPAYSIGGRVLIKKDDLFNALNPINHGK